MVKVKTKAMEKAKTRAKTDPDQDKAENPYIPKKNLKKLKMRLKKP